MMCQFIWQTAACSFQIPCCTQISVTESRANKTHQEQKHMNLLTNEGCVWSNKQENICVFKLVSASSWEKKKKVEGRKASQQVI